MGEDRTMVMPPIYLRKDSGETGGRGLVERVEPLIKTKWILELRTIRLLRNTAGQVAAVEKPKRIFGWGAAMAAMG